VQKRFDAFAGDAHVGIARDDLAHGGEGREGTRRREYGANVVDGKQKRHDG